MKKTRRILSLVMSIVMVLGLCAASVSCTAVDSAKALFEKALGRTLAETQDLGYIGTISRIFSQGSMEVEVGSKDEDFPVSGSVRFYSSADKNRLAVKLSAKADNEKLEAFVYSDENELMVQCDELIGKAYGINLKEFEENFRKSVFNPDSGSNLALDDDQYEQILDVIDFYKKSENARKDAIKILKKAEKEIYKAIEDNAELSKEKTEVDILEYEDVKATLLNVSINNEGLSKAVNSVWKKIKSDKALKNWISDYFPLSTTEFENAGDVMDYLDEAVEDIVGDLEDTDFSVAMSLYLNRSSGAIMRADLSVKEDGEKNTLSIELGNKYKTFEGLKITAKSGSNSKKLYLKVVEDTKDELKLKLEQDMSGDIPEITVKYNRDDGGLTITSESYQSYGGGTVTESLKLNYTEKSGTHTVKFVSYSRNGEKAELPVDITVIFKEKDSVPSSEKYTELLSLDDDKFEELIETVSENFENLSIVKAIGEMIG